MPALGHAVLVEIGGDLAVAGAAVRPWRVDVAEVPGGAAYRVDLTHGGLATSSVLARTWTSDRGHEHHVIDPRTSRPADGPVRTATVWAPTAVAANTWSTAAIVWGDSAAGTPPRGRSRRPAGRHRGPRHDARRLAGRRGGGGMTLWYLARAAGFAALFAATASVTLGALASGTRTHDAQSRDRRVLRQLAHRSAAVVTLAMLALHVDAAGPRQLRRRQPARRPGAVHGRLPRLRGRARHASRRTACSSSP